MSLPLSIGDALDCWLVQPEPDDGLSPRVSPVAWWIERTGPLMWRGYVIWESLGSVHLRTILAEDHDNPDLRFAYLTPIPSAWNQGGIREA